MVKRGEIIDLIGTQGQEKVKNLGFVLDVDGRMLGGR